MKARLASVGSVIVLGVTVHADELRRIALDGGEKVPAPIAEPGKDGIERIHKIQQAAIEVTSAVAQPSRGTILLCPGGGYSILAINHEGRDVAKRLNADGYDVAVLLYHVSEGEKTRSMALDDAKRALALIRQRGPEFGLNPKRVGVMGFSAGGHLSARLVHETAGAKPPDFAVLIYPAYLEKGGKLLEDVVPGRQPTFLYVAANDSWSASSRAYAAYCRTNNLPCEFHEVPTGGHGFGLKNPLPTDVKDWPDQLKAFLEKLPQ